MLPTRSNESHLIQEKMRFLSKRLLLQDTPCEAHRFGRLNGRSWENPSLHDIPSPSKEDLQGWMYSREPSEMYTQGLEKPVVSIWASCPATG